MRGASRTLYRNRLLMACDDEASLAIAPHLEHVFLPRGYVIAGHAMCSDHAFFIETGVAATTTSTSKGTSVETGLFGRDGLVPLGRLLGSDRIPSKSIMLTAGSAWRIATRDLIDAMRRSPEMRQIVWHYAHDLMTQITSTTVAYAVKTTEERLARWLLMFCARFEQDEMPLTHATLASMLGARRSSITEALHILEHQGFIRTGRGTITICDDAGLRAFAGEDDAPSEARDLDPVGDMQPVPVYSKPRRAVYGPHASMVPTR